MSGTGSFVAAANLPRVDRDQTADIGEAEGRTALPVLRSLRDEDWQRTTDCTQWDVRTVVSHLVAQCEDGISLPILLRRELAGRRRHPDLSGVDARSWLCRPRGTATRAPQRRSAGTSPPPAIPQ